MGDPGGTFSSLRMNWAMGEAAGGGTGDLQILPSALLKFDAIGTQLTQSGNTYALNRGIDCIIV